MIGQTIDTFLHWVPLAGLILNSILLPSAALLGAWLRKRFDAQDAELKRLEEGMADIETRVRDQLKDSQREMKDLEKRMVSREVCTLAHESLHKELALAIRPLEATIQMMSAQVTRIFEAGSPVLREEIGSLKERVVNIEERIGPK